MAPRFWLKQCLTSDVIWDGKPGVGELGGQRVFFPHALNNGALTLTPRTISQSDGFRKVLYEALICLSENVPTYSSSLERKRPISSFPSNSLLFSVQRTLRSSEFSRL